MKTAREWLGQTEADFAAWRVRGMELIPAQERTFEWVEAIQADAREQGRREGLEEAAKVCEVNSLEWTNGIGRCEASDALGGAAMGIRELAEKSGGGDCGCPMDARHGGNIQGEEEERDGT